MRRSTVTIGKSKGVPRIWLEGKWLLSSGFSYGSLIHVDIRESCITVVSSYDGERRVSGKRHGTIPVIDLNSTEVGTAFKDAHTVMVTSGDHTITITPSHTELMRVTREMVYREASVFSGGGILTLAASLCGFTPVMAVEVESLYASIYERGHPTASMYQMSISDVPFEEFSKYKPIGLFTAGIPCEPFSLSRRGGSSSLGSSLVPEAHELGDMVFWCLRAITSLNPHTVVLEEVPSFLSSGAYQILLHVLLRLYRHVEARVLDPVDYGCLTGRRRAVIVAQDVPICWPVESKSERLLGDIFDDTGDHSWFDRSSKGWLFDHWDKQTARGNGFASTVYDASSPYIGTIKRRYFAQQGDAPVIAHPTLPSTYRWLTLSEVRRLHGVPETYYLGDSKTVAGEVLGQGVVVDMFRAVIASVVSC